MAGRRTATREAEGAGAAAKPTEGLRAFLYDASSRDTTVDLSAGLVEHLREDQLVWIDVDASSEAAVERLRDAIELRDEDLAFEKRLPVRERGGYVSFRMPALADAADEHKLAELICIVGEAWLVTVHDGRLAFIDAFDEHVHSDSSLGELDAASFTASLLEWELNEYFLALEGVQKDVDAIEEAILGEELEGRVLDALVRLRRRVTHLRNGLTPHRYVYATLAHPSFDVVAGTSAAADFGLLNERLQQALQAADSAQATVVGAVELYMTLTADHTNHVMKVLTTVSLLLLPASLLAGIFGMNMLPKMFLHPWVFAAVIATMVVVGAVALVVLRRLRWL
jgi:magnesium transporter